MKLGPTEQNKARQVIVPKLNGTDYSVGTANTILKQVGLK